MKLVPFSMAKLNKIPKTKLARQKQVQLINFDFKFLLFFIVFITLLQKIMATSQTIKLSIDNIGTSTHKIINTAQ